MTDENRIYYYYGFNVGELQADTYESSIMFESNAFSQVDSSYITLNVDRSWERLSGLMDQVLHLREFDVQEISERWNSQYLFGQSGDSIGVLFFAEQSDLQIFTTVTAGEDLITIDRTASVNSV